MIGGNDKCADSQDSLNKKEGRRDRTLLLILLWLSFQQMNQKERHLNPKERKTLMKREILVACPVSSLYWNTSFNHVNVFVVNGDCLYLFDRCQ